jgi:predicted permease
MHELWRKLKRLAGREEMEARVAEEMAAHLEMKRRDYESAGLSPDRADTAARREVGRISRALEDSREVAGFPTMEAFAQDLRYAIRTLRRSPGFLLPAVLGSGLTIAAVAAVFSVIDASFLRPLPHRDSDRLVVIWDQLRALGFSRFPVSVASMQDYRKEPVFEQIEAWVPGSGTLRLADRAERIETARATAGLMPLLGERTSIGRWFMPQENEPGRGSVVVLSDPAWRRWFGGDPGIVGRRVLIDEESFEVAGVLGPGFRFTLAGAQQPDVWLPFAVVNDEGRNRAMLRLLARLAPGVTVEQAGTRMLAVAARLVRDHRMGMGPNGEDGGFAIAVVPLREEVYGAVRPALYAIGGATLALLLMGCCNTVFLWLTRASSRQQELAVREALGAGTARLIRHRAIEGALTGLAGGVLGLALAWLVLAALQGSPAIEQALPVAPQLDWRALAVATLLSISIGIVCSVAPVWRRSAGVLGVRGAVAERSTGRMRPAIIVAQSALTCALLVSAVLLGRSFIRLMEVDPGFRAAGLLTAQVSLPPRYREPAQSAAYYRRLAEHLERRFGGARASFVSRLPLTFGPGGDPFSIEGRPYRANGPVPQSAHAVAVGPSYFSLLSIPIRDGRAFESRDFEGDGAVVVVSHRLADGFWPGQSAIGHRIVLGAPRPGVRWATIIGVAGDVRSESLTRNVVPQIYFPYQSMPGRAMAVVARGGGAAAEELRKAVAAADSGAALYAVATMDERISGSVSGPRLRALLFSGYSVLAFALAIFGVYSLMSYSVDCRKREFAMRMALGATGARLVRMLTGQALWLVAGGALIGLILAVVLRSALEKLLFGVSALDAWSYAMAAILVTGVSSMAGLVPAWRASRVAPARVLSAD